MVDCTKMDLEMLWKLDLWHRHPWDWALKCKGRNYFTLSTFKKNKKCKNTCYLEWDGESSSPFITIEGGFSQLLPKTTHTYTHDRVQLKTWNMKKKNSKRNLASWYCGNFFPSTPLPSFHNSNLPFLLPLFLPVSLLPSSIMYWELY